MLLLTMMLVVVARIPALAADPWYAVEPEKAPSAEVTAIAKERRAARQLASADLLFGAVVARGPADPHFGEALAGLIDWARESDDWFAVDQALEELHGEGPACCADVVAWRRGHHLAAVDKLRQAKESFERVDVKSEWYPRAAYELSVLYARQGRSKSAVRLSSEVFHATPSPKDRGGVDRHSELRQGAVLNIARVYYFIGQYSQAAKYYGEVVRTEAPSAHANIEIAWAHLLAGEMGPITADLARLDEHGGQEAWLPDLPLLRGALALRSGREREVGASLLELAAIVDPVSEALAAALVPETDGAVVAGALAERFLGKASPLPPPLVAEFRKDSMVRGSEYRITQLGADLLLLSSALPDRTAAFAARLRADRLSAQHRLDARLLVLFAREHERLADLRWRGSLLGFEAKYPHLDDAGANPPRADRLAAAADLERIVRQAPGPRSDASSMAFRVAELLREEESVAMRMTRYEDILTTWPMGRAARQVGWELALARYDQGDIEGAAGALDTLLERVGAGADTPDAHVLLGDLRFLQGDYSRAEAAYTLAASSPTSSNIAYAAYKRAWCRWGLGDHAGAVARLREVVGDSSAAASVFGDAARDLRTLEAALAREAGR